MMANLQDGLASPFLAQFVEEIRAFVPDLVGALGLNKKNAGVRVDRERESSRSSAMIGGIESRERVGDGADLIGEGSGAFGSGGRGGGGVVVGGSRDIGHGGGTAGTRGAHHGAGGFDDVAMVLLLMVATSVMGDRVTLAKSF